MHIRTYKVFTGIELFGQCPKRLHRPSNQHRAFLCLGQAVRTLGFCLKNPSSKTASGNGRFNACRFAYNPVSGERKSGIPADVEMPAPVSKMMFLASRV